MRTPPGIRVAAVLVAVTMSGCSFSSVAFRQDERVEIVTPERRATVSLPVTMRWRSRDLERSTQFAVFVDRAPMPPGKSLRYLAHRDTACRHTPGCPDEEWFHNRHIYRTKKTSLTLTDLPDTRPRERLDRKERHEVVIVLVDDTGRRLGESAFFAEFFLQRPQRG